MTGRAVLGFLAVTVLLASSWAHAFLGWPALEPALASQGVDGELIGALAIGWYFGSVSMLVFGLIVLHAAWQVFRGRSSSNGPLQTIALAYLLFGSVAFVVRDFNPHFLLFVVTGLLVGAFATGRGAPA